MVLYETPDLWGVFELADLVRERLHPGVGYYNINRHLNYSNVCALSCKFCEFYRKKGDEGAYTRTWTRSPRRRSKACESGATEMHIVGGLQPYLPWDYYPEMIRTIKRVADEHASTGPTCTSRRSRRSRSCTSRRSPRSTSGATARPASA
jgi:aminodeoxyfutalosine synthase